MVYIMIHIVNSELLKLKKTFALKLVWIAPVFIWFFFYISDKNQGNAYNWWYSIILPAMLAIICSAVIQKDKKTKYHSVLNLPLSKTVIWTGKMLICSELCFISCIIFMIGITLFGFTVKPTVMFIQSLVGCILLFITISWQIPFCMFLSAKFGAVGAILTNTACNIYGLAVFSSSKLWYLFPYAITIRVMYPLLHNLPGGFPKNSQLLNSDVILPGILLSIIWFILMTSITVIWFRKQEAK